MTTADRRVLRFDWIREREAFFALADAYNELAAETVDTIFLTHTWLRVWLEELAPRFALRTLVAWDGERLVGVLPIGAEKPGARTWTFVGAGVLTPNHLDVVADPALLADVLAGFSAMLVEARREWDMLDLDKLPADSPTCDALAAALSAARIASTCAPSAKCPYCTLPDTWDEYVATRSQRMRKKLRQAERRRTESVPPAAVTLATTPQEAAEALAALVSFHQARWEDRGYPGAFADPAVIRFHERVMPAQLAENRLRIFTFRVGEQIAGVSYDYHVGHVVQAYLSSFDETFSSLSPGTLMRAAVIRDAVAEGAARFDFLEGTESYKEDWCECIRDNVRLRAFSATLAGNATRARLLAGEAIVGAARRWIPADVRERAVKMLMHQRVSRPEER